jgi:hypothetical protein
LEGEDGHDEIGKRLRVLGVGVGVVIATAMWGYNQEPEPRPEQPQEATLDLSPALEARMESMCRGAINDRRIRGAVDRASVAGSRYGADFENTPWAQADAVYVVGDWGKDEPSIDWAIVGPGQIRELHHWEISAGFGAGSLDDPGALVGRVWCRLIVDPKTEEAWFRRPSRDPGEDMTKHFWLTPGEPEALVIMEHREP